MSEPFARQIDQRITKWAERVRGAVERLQVDDRLKDLCGPASLALAVALESDGMNPRMVQGWYRNKKQPHIWTECDGMIIDLTLTQFHPRARKVFIASDTDARFIVCRKYRKLEGMLARLDPWAMSMFFRMANP